MLAKFVNPSDSVSSFLIPFALEAPNNAQKIDVKHGPRNPLPRNPIKGRKEHQEYFSRGTCKEITK